MKFNNQDLSEVKTECVPEASVQPWLKTQFRCAFKFKVCGQSLMFFRSTSAWAFTSAAIIANGLLHTGIFYRQQNQNFNEPVTKRLNRKKMLILSNTIYMQSFIFYNILLIYFVHLHH